MSRFRSISLWWKGLEWLLEKDKWPKNIIRGYNKQDEIAVLFQKENKEKNIN